MLIGLYNPHGSDGTNAVQNKINELEQLYNPHGSDGTMGYDIEYVERNTFITHTVQMELFKKVIDSVEDIKLYNPHGSDGTVVLFLF